MSKADAWMPLHIGPYLADTMHLTTVQHGAYILLLMHYWRTGPLPDDDRRLAGIARMNPCEWGEHGDILREFFAIGDDGLLHQKRADTEMARAAEISAKRADAGREGQRRQNAGKTLANAGQLPDTCRANAGQLPPHARVLIPLPSPSKKDHSPSAHVDQTREAHGSRLPADWAPNADDCAYAADRGLDISRVTEDFRDFWHAKAGSGARKADWTKTWQTWCRRAADERDARLPRARASPPRNANGDQIAARLAGLGMSQPKPNELFDIEVTAERI